MEVFRSEIKTGLFIAASIVFLIVGMFLISDLRHVWEKKNTFTIRFENADGLTQGSPVWFAGFQVGDVTRIQIDHGEVDRIAVTVEVASDARVREDSRVFIRNLGLMGSKYVEITPGSPDARVLPSGTSLDGESPTSLSEILESGKRIALQLQETIGEVRGLVQAVREDAKIPETVRNVNALLQEMQSRGRELKPILQKIEMLASSLNETSLQLRRTASVGGPELTSLIREIRQTNRNLQTILSHLNKRIPRVMDRARQDLAEAGGLLQDARTMVDANEMNVFLLIRHLKETSRHLEALSEDLRAHPWKVVWKARGTSDNDQPMNPVDWREHGRVGMFGRE